MLLALRRFSDHKRLENMRIFAFNDYSDSSAVALAAKALEMQTKVRVIRKAELFMGVGGRYDVGYYGDAAASMLVVHNNSDGFGQNIETEKGFGSLDGAVGSISKCCCKFDEGEKGSVGLLMLKLPKMESSWRCRPLISSSERVIGWGR